MEEPGESTVIRLLRIVAGETPIHHGVEIVAQDVVIHMDGHTFFGINTWANWLCYMRSRSRVSDLNVEVDRLVRNPDGTITAHGRWKARQRGEAIFSRDVSARYRVVNGVVAEIWTTRTNYVFVLGPIMNSRAGHWLIMLHLFFWAKRAGTPDLRTSPAVAPGPAPALHSWEESAGT